MTISKYDEVTPGQKSYIVSLLYHASPRVTAHTPHDEWIAELNSLCNLNIASLDDLSKAEASRIIDQLKH